MLARILTVACALCLAVPVAAGASQSTPPDKVMPKGPYGAVATAPPNVVKAKGPYGVTAAEPQPAASKPQGPYGTTDATGVPNAVVKGPYGVTSAPSPQRAGEITAHGAERADGWRTAAILEGGLLAALALGSATLLASRRRVSQMGV
jgi:hypothetical protein